MKTKRHFRIIRRSLGFKFQDENKNIKVGDNISKIMSSECETLEVKEILHGEPYKTWKIVIDNNDKIYLLKTSRELK